MRSTGLGDSPGKDDGPPGGTGGRAQETTYYPPTIPQSLNSNQADHHLAERRAARQAENAAVLALARQLWLAPTPTPTDCPVLHLAAQLALPVPLVRRKPRRCRPTFSSLCLALRYLAGGAA